MNDREYTIMFDTGVTPGAVVEKDGVHFGYFAQSDETPALLLYQKGSSTVAAKIPFPEKLQGGFYSMKVKLSPSKYEYNFCEDGRVITDPYARKIVGREIFGQEPPRDAHELRGGFLTDNYDWEGDCEPQIPCQDTVMYHLHVRGYTMQKNSGVRRKGTFAGLREKIPYLQELGINQVRLMPVYEFAEMIPQLPDSTGLPKSMREALKRAMEPEPAQDKTACRMNFWGYGDGFYFAPKASYAAGKHPEQEFKDMVKAFHAAGIEVLLDFAFTDDTDVCRIGACLNYWAAEYHVDGFCILARESLTAELAGIPLFRRKKLICSWYPDRIREKNIEKGYLLAESNDGFMNDCRRILRGEAQLMEAFGYRLRQNTAGSRNINYITNHDGFTLLDLVSYDRKHNEANGEQGHDGSDYNFSWNCGEEGDTKKRDIQRLRMRQRKNAYAMLLFSQGTPMLLAGDEFGNSQEGNNNPYCHDNELSWTDWGRARSNKELTAFVKQAIAYRKAHRVLHQKTELKCADGRSTGYPDLSFHGERARYGDFEHASCHVGSMFSGYYAEEDTFVYIAWNFDPMTRQFALPLLPRGKSWYPVMDTSRRESFLPEEQQVKLPEGAKVFEVPARTVVILEGK